MAGYRVKIIFLGLPSADMAVARVANWVAEGGHDVPEHLIRRRFVAGLRNFADLYAPLIDGWQLYGDVEPHGNLSPGRVLLAERNPDDGPDADG